MDKIEEFEPMFYPRSVAVIGASADERKFGGRFLRTLQEFGFNGELYPVNPRESEVAGLKAYATVKDVPSKVDFAVVTIPAHFVPQVLEDCVAKGVKAAEIFSSGFSETDTAEGRRLEQKLRKIAKKGIRLVGPNCFGIYCPGGGLTLLPGSDFPKESGPVAFVTQSGGHAVELAREARGWGIRFSKIISYGNACDVNEADLLEYLALDPETRIITAYIEGTREGRRFRELVQQVSKTKPVVIWKGGLTQAGARAVSSHTGSLAGEEAAWDALFKQTGALRVRSKEELIDATVALLHLPPNTGRRVAVVGGGGGISVAAADACDEVGLAVPPLSRRIQRELSRVIPPAGTSVRNPIDVGRPVIFVEEWHKVLESAASARNIDTLIATQAMHLFMYDRMRAFFDTSGSFVQDSLQAPVSIKERFNKPIVMVLPEGGTEVEMMEVEKTRRQFRDFYFSHQIPVYPTLERAARAVAKVVEYWQNRNQSTSAKGGKDV